MIDLAGSGVLAVWNGVEPSRSHEYDVWHTREHVPKRVSVPGILGARRYVRLHGPLPEYLTLYALEDTRVLTSEPYKTLLNNPTAWSRSMRPWLRDFMRVSCHRMHSVGGGSGSTLVAAMLDDRVDIRSHHSKSWAEQAVAYDGITSIHMLERDASVPDVPFQVGGTAPAFPQAGVVLIEGYGPGLFEAAARHLAAIQTDCALKTLTAYQLAYALDRDSLNHVARMSRKV